MFYDRKREKGLKPTVFHERKPEKCLKPIVFYERKQEQNLKSTVFYEGKQEKALKPSAFCERKQEKALKPTVILTSIDYFPHGSASHHSALTKLAGRAGGRDKQPLHPLYGLLEPHANHAAHRSQISRECG